MTRIGNYIPVKQIILVSIHILIDFDLAAILYLFLRSGLFWFCLKNEKRELGRSTLE